LRRAIIGAAVRCLSLQQPVAANRNRLVSLTARSDRPPLFSPSSVRHSDRKKQSMPLPVSPSLHQPSAADRIAIDGSALSAQDWIV